ncbi:MAG TPA: exodeoxyribonuclease VII large subunit, partial [Rhodothermales bacterium]
MEGPQIRPLERERVLSVGEFAAGLRAHVERRFADVWIGGEISNLRNASSGHVYFSLKDDRAQIRCVMWRSTARTVPFRLQDGMEIRVRGGVTFYEPRGDLQIVVRQLQAAGEGALRQAFEVLKQRLAAEGLFDPARKRHLPIYPEHIGIVTSGDGAALQDMLTILRRRYPIARVSIYSVRVQGFGAAEEIAAAVNALGSAEGTERPDVVIVGRGGGSIEDLWAFNEEVVARAIFRCAVPVVSAVGHETDFSIADFVADLRAATPSNAAELVVPDQRDLARRIR